MIVDYIHESVISSLSLRYMFEFRSFWFRATSESLRGVYAGTAWYATRLAIIYCACATISAIFALIFHFSF